jgi:hypothetical protein
MTKLIKLALAAAAFAAAPAVAGPTEIALRVCTTAALQAAPGADVTTRKIVEGGRATKIGLWVKTDTKRQFDCSVSAKGEVTTAFADADKGTALATANQP